MRKIDVRNFQRATRDTSREINRRILLNLLREKGPVSRAELARAMEVPRGMITSLVNELLDDGLVFEGATTSAPRGRRPRLLHLRSHDRLALAVDVRAGSTALRVSDFAGTALADADFPTPRNPGELVDEILRRGPALLDAAGRSGELEGIGVVVPGMVDTTSGVVLNAPTLGWRDAAVGCELARRSGHRVWVERDAVACALASIWVKDAPDAGDRSFVYVVVSEGVGAGLVLNGQVVRGRHYTAGEFGHVPLDPRGPECSCGSRGCLEAFTCDPATVRRYRERRRGEGPRTDDTGEIPGADAADEVTVAQVVDRALAGDAHACHALQETGRYLGQGLAGMINAFDPARIIIGGEVARGWSAMEEVVRASLTTRTLTEAASRVEIAVDPSHSETRIHGAMALVVAPAFAAPRVA